MSIQSETAWRALALPLDGARRLYATGIEQQLLGEGRLARVGVRDDGEGAPRGNLI